MEKEFEKNFEKIYNIICDSCKNTLKQAKNRNRSIFLSVFIVFAIILFRIYINENTRNLTILSGALLTCFLLILLIFLNKVYRKIYKENVIKGLVNAYNEKFHYTPTIGISRSEYRMSHFDDDVDEYYSEDRIYGTLEKGDEFQLAELATYEISRYVDEEEKVTEVKTQTFRGLYGVVKLAKNTLSDIYIASNSKTRKFSKNRLEVDSSLFEEYYDCITKDRVNAMRIFTSELIEKYIDIVKDNKYGFELKIIDNLIYFRYKTKQIFEPPKFSLGLDKDLLKKNYKAIYYPLEIMRLTVEAVHDVFEQ